MMLSANAELLKEKHFTEGWSLIGHPKVMKLRVHIIVLIKHYPFGSVLKTFQEHMSLYWHFRK